MAYNKTVWVDNSSPKINATNLNNIENGIEANDTIITGLKGQKLWENDSPTSPISAKQVILNSNDYDLLLWIILRQASQPDRTTNPLFILKGYNGTAIGVTPSGATVRRGIEYVDDTHYNITQSVTPSIQDEGDSLIPLYVIGYKTGLF